MLGGAVSSSVPARAAVAGNPSDGYGGVVMAVPVPELTATVEVEPARTMRVVPLDPPPQLRTIDQLVAHTDHHGLVGAAPLLAAAVVRFSRFTGWNGPALELRWRTTIPRSVGLGGSSALVLAALRSVARHAGVALSPEQFAGLALQVETDELGFVAGLQDRAVQSFGAPLAMDFSDVDESGGVPVGGYRVVAPAAEVGLYVAWNAATGSPSPRVHQDLRSRFEAGVPQVSAAMRELASIAVAASWAFERADLDALAAAVDASADVRRSVMACAPEHVALVDAARSVGASANFAGSGGAIVGTPGPGGVEAVRAALEPSGCEVRPLTFGPADQVPL